MLDLHYSPGNANLAPHMLLNLLGLPHRLVRVDRDNAAHKSPAYLALNPNGLIPLLVDGDLATMLAFDHPWVKAYFRGTRARGIAARGN